MQDKANQLDVIYQTVISPQDNLLPLFLTVIIRGDNPEPQEELERFLWRAFRTPITATMSFNNWTRIAKDLEHSGFWEYLENRWPFYLHDKLWEDWRREVKRVRSEIKQCMEPNNFAKSSLRGLLSQSMMGGFSLIAWRRRPTIGITFPIMDVYGSPLTSNLVIFLGFLTT